MSSVATRTFREAPKPFTDNGAQIRELVTKAANVLAPVWPLKTFIACNPLQGLEDLPFEEATAKSSAYLEMGKLDIPARHAVNRETIKWCSTFLDEGQATIPMPNKNQGFYRSFADLARFDSRLTRSKGSIPWLASLPEHPEEAIRACLQRLKLTAENQEEFIRQSLAALPGWSGYIQWRSEWQNRAEGIDNPIRLVDYVAVQLIITCLLWPDAKVLEIDESKPPAYLAKVSIAEQGYRHGLLEKILQEVRSRGVTAAKRPDAQLVFCIDVRSEPFRRSLESQGAYETLGFAGFFGLPVRVKGYDADRGYDSCPVLLKPCHEVCECPSQETTAAVLRHDHGRSLLKLPKSLYQSLKYNFATPFALVEMLGPWFGLRMLARTLAPSLTKSLKSVACDTIMPSLSTELSLKGITVAQQAEYGESALRMMGLTENMAPLVVLCGHGSTTDNNAYAAALDCGACGGNHGGGNAKILATILNQEDVRAILSSHGLSIPKETRFIAAEHDTTTDHVHLYEDANLDANLDATFGNRLAKLREDLAKARTMNATSRCGTFGLSIEKGTEAENITTCRSRDWAEVRPEWGLARNAAFIVGPRDLTRNLNLEGRCFLHSYDWKTDNVGRFLQTILTAPMVVAQWINNQYLFSTLDNVAYGGGSKVTKNVTGKLGVMQGNASDLMHGLPLQSVYAADDKPYHEPLRLLTVVYARQQMVHILVETNAVLQKLFYNGWVTLVVIDPQENLAYELQRDSTWKQLS